MIKKALLATAAVLATSAPAYAQEITSSLNFTNNIQTSVVNSSNYASNLNVNGGVTVGGTINVDTAATAERRQADQRRQHRRRLSGNGRHDRRRSCQRHVVQLRQQRQRRC